MIAPKNANRTIRLICDTVPDMPGLLLWRDTPFIPITETGPPVQETKAER
jgi:hypothetical protein